MKPTSRSGRSQPSDFDPRGASAVPNLEACLRRIRQLEPKLQAWVQVDEAGARRAAETLDQNAAKGRRHGHLHGMPIGIKDIIDVAGLPTLAGSRQRLGHMAQQDAPLVRRLRRAGAIILGKTVTTEYASFDPPPTRNPWNPERTPGGSSSGSAVAVATGMCRAAVGTQTGGSITRPASYCGICGLKPTFRALPTKGIVPFASHLDHPGPMARTIADLQVMYWSMLDARQMLREFNAGSAIAPEPPRLGLVADYFLSESSPEVQRVTRESLEKLKSRGAVVVPVKLPPEFSDVHRHHRAIMAIEAAAVHRAALERDRASFGPNIGQLLDEGLAARAVDYVAALDHQRQFRRALRAAFEGVDALVTPATPSTAPSVETTGDPKFNSPWSYSGLPTVSFPVGLASDKLPLALQLIGKPRRDSQLLAHACWCEVVLEFWRVPRPWEQA